MVERYLESVEEERTRTKETASSRRSKAAQTLAAMYAAIGSTFESSRKPYVVEYEKVEGDKELSKRVEQIALERKRAAKKKKSRSKAKR